MKKRVLSALLAICLTLSLAGAAFAENETLSPAQETSVSESASSAAEPQEEKESEVEAEEISTAETAQEPSYPAQDFEAAVDGADMTVNVSAPEGALPEDVILTASLVGSSEDNADDQAVADVAAELDDADVEYDGFVALDISFVDADGNKVEPLQPVSVNFTLPAELLPEDVDASTLEVQHLKEDAETEEVVAVETVADTADATEGTVTVDTPVATLSEDAEATLPADAEVAAEFTVEGFSTFTITWKNDNSIDVVCIDNRGVRIGEDSVSFGKENINNVTDLNSDIAPEIEGYTFKEARAIRETTIFGAQTGYEAVKATQIKYQTIGDISWELLLTGWYYLCDGEWSRVTNFDIIVGVHVSLYFVYTKDPVDPGEEPETPDSISPMYTKTAEKNDDGTYNLTLSVTGAVASQAKKMPLDVIFVIDESRSMNDSMGNGDKTNRMSAVKESIKDLTNSLSKNSDISVRYNIVTFSGLSATRTLLDWTPESLTNSQAAQGVSDALNSISPNGGTNYQAGLRAASNNLASARDGATTCVIFLTDGEPTFRIWDGYEVGNGSDDNERLNIDGAIAEAGYVSSNLFYCVGVGSEFSDETSYKVQNLQAIANAANAGTSDWASAADTTTLKNKFASMTAMLTTITVTNVTIEDELSQNVTAVDEGAIPEVTVENAAGVDVTDTEFASLISTSPDDNKIYAKMDKGVLTLNFPDTYILKEDYTYKVKLKIKPSELAKERFRDNGYDYPKDSVTGKYTDVGEPGTGTHAGQGGFFSNVAESAILTYTCLNTINGEEIKSGEQTREYPMPVIQVDETSLTISKAFAGSWENFTDEQKADAISKITFTICESGSATPVQSDISLEKNREGYTAVVDGLTVGKTYSVTETCSAPDGYDVTVDGNSKTTGALVADPSQNMISFTNTYTPATASLSITKHVDGYQGGDNTFEITVQGPNEVAGKSFEDASGKMIASFNENAVATLSLKDSETVTITGLPKGEMFKVEESASSQGDIDTKPDDGKKDYYLDKTLYKIGEEVASENSEQFELNADTAVTVTNSYKPYMTLVVKKIVTGEMGSNSDPFDFTARYTSNNDKVELLSSQDPTDDKNDFKLTGGSSVTLINLKEGQEFTITEAGTTNGYTFKEIDVDSSVLVKKDTENSNGYVTGTSYITIKVPAANAPTALGTVTFTNERKAVAPTGLEDNHTKPFGLMVGVAVMAGLALAGGAVVRRRRRWME